VSALEEYRKLADDRQWLIIDDIFDKADAAIAELEALVNANTDHMTEVGVELCRERDARISELEAENQLVKDDFDRMQRECKHEKIRAEQAEAALAELRNAVQRLVDESSSVWSNKALRAAQTVDLLLARAEEGSG